MTSVVLVGPVIGRYRRRHRDHDAFRGERREQDVGESDDPVLRDLESRTEATDRKLPLIVEAVRP